MKKELIISLILALFTGGFIFFLFVNKPAKKTSTPQETKTEVQSSLTLESVQSHATETDCYMIIENRVYDVTSYLPSHPAGPETMIPYCGKDATDAFNSIKGKGHSQSAKAMLETYLVGDLKQ
jgi:cytochrome b involved in lipid metabolism